MIIFLPCPMQVIEALTVKDPDTNEWTERV